MQKFATRLKFTSTISAGVISALTVGAAAYKGRTLQQVIDAGTAAGDATAIKVADTGIVFMVESQTSADWEEAYYTVTSGTLLTKGAVIASSNAGAAVSFPGGVVDVYNTPAGSFLRKVITTDDGVGIKDLSAVSGTPSDSFVVPMQDPATGMTYSITVSALKTLFGNAAPAQQIVVNTISSQVAGTAFSVSGTYANVTPGSLEWSINGGSTYNPATATIGGGTFTISGVTVPGASNSQTVLVRDVTTKVAGASAAFLVTAAPYITVNTPSSQVVSAAFPVTGWYYNFTPTALDYRFSDDTAGVWTQAAAGTTSITGGAFQISVTCSTVNASRTISVRDRTTQSILATSGAFSVAAGAATVSSVQINQSNPSVVGGQTLQLTDTVTGTNNPSQAGTWSMVSGPGSVNASTGLYTPGPATASAQTAVVKFVSQQDSNYSAQVSITIPAQTITVTAPGASPTVGAAYTLAGTWTGLQPSALDFQYADNGGTATAWATLTGAVINSNGTWSASITPTSASTSRVMSVRDHTTLIQGSTAAYVVNASTALMKDTFSVINGSSAAMTAGTTGASASSPDYFASPAGNIRVYVRDSSGNACDPTKVKFVFGLYDDANCPISTFGQAGLQQGANGTQNSGGHGNGYVVGQALAGWNYAGAQSQSNYGVITPAASMYAWFGPGAPVGALTSGMTVRMKLWVVFSDNSAKAHSVDGVAAPTMFTFTVP